jgi:outer membrane lipoprotein
MRKRRNSTFWSILLILGIAGCAGGISKQVRSQVTFFGPFKELQQNPERFRGEMMMFGGKIIETQALGNGTEIIVLHLELNASNRPDDNDQSQGRYVVRSDQFIDPAIYPPGTLVTVAGRLLESEARQIGQMSYHYPVIDLEEIKKWPKQDATYPRLHFGVGVGTTF